MRKILSLFAAVLVALVANSTVIQINNSTPDALRLALSTAATGDVIEMAAGTYVESPSDYIAFAGKDVTVKAAEGAEVIIQPQVSITVSEGGCAHFQNVKIDASRLIEVNNWYEHLIYATDAANNSINLQGCELYGFNLNKSMLYCNASNKLATVIINNCYIHNTMKSVLFVENTTDAISVLVANSTFANISTNTESYWAGIIDLRNANATLLVDLCTFYNVIPMNTDYSCVSKITLANGVTTNCIFMLPTAQDGIRAMRGVTAANCITYNYLKDSGTGIHSSVTQTNCVQVDPLFVDAANGNFTLGANSPALTLNGGQPIGDPRWVPADPKASVYGSMTDPAWTVEVPFTLAQDKKSATLTANITKGEYQFKMMINGEWRANGYTYHRGYTATAGISGNGDNMILKTDVDGDYTFTWTFANDSLSIIYPAEPVVELDTIYSYYGKRTESASATSATEKGGTAVAEGGNSNIVVGIAQKTNWTIKLNKGFSNTNYVGITLEKELKAGDQMQLAAFIASDNVAELGIDFSASKETASTDCRLLFSGLQLITTNAAPNDTVVTIPAAAAGAKYIRVYRNSGSTGVYIANLTILRDPNTPEPPAQPEYYLIGSMNNWKLAADSAHLFVVNPKNNAEYMLDFTLAEQDTFKVVKVLADTINTWYPANNYIVDADHAGQKTIYFRPDGQGGDDWFDKTIYIAPNPKPITCADVYKAAKNDVVLLNPVTVTYVNGKNVYVKDATGAMLLYLPANATWKAGDVLTGVEGTVDIYNGLYEVKPSADQVAAVAAVAGEAPAPEALKAITTADINKYVSLASVKFAEDTAIVANTVTNVPMILGETTYVLRNNFKLAQAFEAAKSYDMVGVVSYFVKNADSTLQFFPVTIEEHKDGPSAVPTVAAPVPTWPAKQVKSLYSNAYAFAPESLNSYNEAWWDRPTMVEEEISGDKYLHYNGLMTGMIGWQFGEINVSNMEYIHIDVWPSADATFKMGPTTENKAGGDNYVAAVNLTAEAGKWNSIDIPVADLLAANPNFSLASVFQNQFTGYSALTDLSIDNIFFYTTVAPAADTVAPTAFTAVLDAASYFSVNIKANATDNSGAVEFDVLNGELIIASAKAASATDRIITVGGLTPNTDYNFSVIAKDEEGNATEPIAVVAKTLAAPAPAPAPTAAADDVKSIYSDAYDFAPDTLNSYNESWWNAPVMVEGKLAEGDNALFYAAATTGMIGWQFGEMDLTAYTELHIDIYPIADGSILIYPVNNTDPKGEYKDTYNVKGGQWNSLVIDLSGKDLTKIFQIGWIEYYALNGFFIDNVYFTKKAETPESPYYLVGTMTDWKPAAAYQFEANPATAGEYMLETTLTVGDKFKVAKSENGETIADSDWYPGGMGNDYVVDADHAGAVIVYFRPDGQGGEGWHEGYIYVAAGQGVENTNDGLKAVKKLENGMLLIEKNGMTYTVTGIRVK